MKLERLDGVTSTVIGEVVMCLIYSEGAHVATKYLDERTVVRATRPRLKQMKKRGKPVGTRKLNGGYRYDTRINVVVTVGAPNYAGREFIKACKKAGETFPVKKIQLKYLPG